VWGKFRTSVREQDCHDFCIRVWGTRGLSRRPRSIGAERDRT